MAEATRPDGPASVQESGEAPFEAALERLEAVVDRLERGDLALEEALAAFEEGVGLTRRLGAQLDDAERRVEQLLREGGGVTTRPLADEEIG